MNLKHLKPFTIGIAASSGAFDRALFEKGIEVLKNLGFSVWYRQDIFERERYLAGSDTRRRDELHELFMHPEIDAIMFARGGYGVQRLLPLLDAQLINKHAKPVLGYSDLTALFLWLHKNTNISTWYGPVVTHLSKYPNVLTQESLVSTLITPRASFTIPTEQSKAIKSGKASGKLVGGCLTMLSSCVGTPHALQLNKDILFLEDVFEPLYKIDRALTHLRQSGTLEKASGIIFGKTEVPDCTLEEFHQFLADFFIDSPCPVLADFPAGHTETFVCLPLKRQVELITGPNETKLSVLE